MRILAIAEGEPPQGGSMKVHPCPRDHTRESRAAAGYVLCTPCVRQVERNLRTLPGLYQECLHHVSPLSRQISPTKISGSRTRDHLNISVLDSRFNILATLESWAHIVVEQLGAGIPGRSVPELSRFLQRHLKWLLAQPPAGEFADEAERFVAELRGIIDPASSAPRTIIRQCVVDGCSGTISMYSKGAGNSARRNIECSAGHSWELHEWLNLRHLMERQRKDVSA